MDSIISVQDIRTSLGSIARRAEEGETFTVIRNSKPVFRLVPVAEESRVREPRPVYGTSSGVSSAQTKITLEEIHRRFEETGANQSITPEDVDRIIHAEHAGRTGRR